MRSKRLAYGTERTWALVFERGDEVVAELTEWADHEEVRAGRLTGIGGFSAVTLGFFSPEEKGYRKIPVDEQSEVLSLIGDIAMVNDGPLVHAHVVVGLSDGTARGGHLLKGEVWPTLEVLVTQSPAYLPRKYDPSTGLTLLDLDPNE